MSEQDDTSYLDGQMLIAMPGIGDPRFDRTVIYLCAHSAEGAMGIVVNKPAENIDFSDLLERLNIISDDESINLPTQVMELPVHFGGPVEMGRGFVLHTADYFRVRFDPADRRNDRPDGHA